MKLFMREGNGHSDSVRKEHNEKKWFGPVVDRIKSLGSDGYFSSGRFGLAAGAFLLLTGLAACTFDATMPKESNKNLKDSPKKEEIVIDRSSDTVSADATLEVSYNNPAPDTVDGADAPVDTTGEATVPEDTGVDTPVVLTDAQDGGETDGSTPVDGCVFGYCFDIPVPVDVVESESGEDTAQTDSVDGTDAPVDTPVVLTDAQDGGETGTDAGVDQGTQPDVSVDSGSVLTDQVVLSDVPIIPLVDAQDGGETDGSTPVDGQEAGAVPVDSGVGPTDTQETGVDQGAQLDVSVDSGLDTPEEVAPDVPPEAEVYTPPWWDPWSDCTTITIVGDFPEGYSHQITLDPATIDMLLFNPDGSDVRFYEGDCEGGPTEGVLNQWIESWSQDKGIVWVKTNTPDVPTIAMIYGNVDALNVSNISTTFLFGDDFSGTELDSTKWKKIGSGTMIFKDGVLAYSGNTGNAGYGDTLESQESFGPGTELRAKRICDYMGANLTELGFGSYSNEPDKDFVGETDWSVDDAAGVFIAQLAGSSSYSVVGVATDWRTGRIIWETDLARFSLTNEEGITSSSTEITSNVPNDLLPIHLGGSYSGYDGVPFKMKIDYLFVREATLQELYYTLDL